MAEKTEEKKMEEKISESSENKKESTAEKTEIKNKKKIEKPAVKKEFAIARATGIHISKRHGMYICSFIKGKKIDDAISDLEQVMKLKKIIPFKGEIPHRKGKGMMSGRYPVKACKIIIPVLKALKGNCIVNGLDLEKTVICEGYSNWASRPMKSGNRRAKRAHLVLKAKEITETKK